MKSWAAAAPSARPGLCGPVPPAPWRWGVLPAPAPVRTLRGCAAGLDPPQRARLYSSGDGSAPGKQGPPGQSRRDFSGGCGRTWPRTGASRREGVCLRCFQQRHLPFYVFFKEKRVLPRTHPAHGCWGYRGSRGGGVPWVARTGGGLGNTPGLPGCPHTRSPQKLTSGTTRRLWLAGFGGAGGRRAQTPRTGLCRPAPGGRGLCRRFPRRGRVRACGAGGVLLLLLARAPPTLLLHPSCCTQARGGPRPWRLSAPRPMASALRADGCGAARRLPSPPRPRHPEMASPRLKLLTTDGRPSIQDLKSRS